MAQILDECLLIRVVKIKVVLFSCTIFQHYFQYPCGFSSDVASNYWHLTVYAYFDLQLSASIDSQSFFPSPSPVLQRQT